MYVSAEIITIVISTVSLMLAFGGALAGVFAGMIRHSDKNTKELRTDMKEEFRRVYERFDKVDERFDKVGEEFTGVRQEIGAVKEELTEKINTVKEDLTKEINGVKVTVANLTGTINGLHPGLAKMETPAA